MFITDRDGKKIEVTDLNAAIEQVKVFRELQHDDPLMSELDTSLHTYWDDVYQKLLELKQNL